MFLVKQGKRPNRPSDELSRTRGLVTSVWQTIEQCWSHNPTQRLSTVEVVEKLRVLPSACNDTRPPDEFASYSPAQLLYRAINHPFSPLSDITGGSEVEDDDPNLPEIEGTDQGDAIGDKVGTEMRSVTLKAKRFVH